MFTESPIHSWKIRRAFMFVVVGFSMAVILLALLVKPDAGVSNTVVLAAFGAISATLGSYVFGATWDDKNKAAAEVSTAKLVLGKGDM